MSDHDEARVPGQEAEHGAGAPRAGGGWALLVIGLVLGLIVGWGGWAPLIYAKKAQPFPFNHKAHTEGAGMECEECHSFNDEGRFSGAPAFTDCLLCHTWGDRQNEDNERETAFLKQFVSEDDELIGDPQWYIYSGQPDCVYFSHVAHTQMGKLSCEECHGDHGKTATLRPFYQNRLTGYSRDVYEKMKMTDCGDCHTRKQKPENNACFVCHK